MHGVARHVKRFVALLCLPFVILPPPTCQGRGGTPARAAATYASPDPPIRFTPAVRTFTDEVGIPQNSVTAIVTDRQGRLWVGTQDGAAHFNGRNWTTLNMPACGEPGEPKRIVSNWVTAILPRRNGEIWFGTQKDGIHVYNHDKDNKWIGHHATDALPAEPIASLIESADAPVVWAALRGGGLARYAGGRWEVFNRNNSRLPNDVVHCLLETDEPDGTKALWVGTDGGLALFKGSVCAQVFTVEDGLPHNRVRCLLETNDPDAGRTLWIGTHGGGLARYGNRVWKVVTGDFGDSFKEIRCLLETVSDTHEHFLWVGSNRSGLGLLRLKDERWMETYDVRSGVVPNNEISCLFEMRKSQDPEAASPNGPPLLWIGTNSGGLARIRMGKWSRAAFNTDAIPSKAAKCFLETRDEDGERVFWIGTRSDGLARLAHGEWKMLTPESSPVPSPFVTCLLETKLVTPTSTVWIGTSNRGLLKLDARTPQLFNRDAGLPDNAIWALLETTDDDGVPVLWVGTEGGLAQYRNGVWTTFDALNSQLPRNHVQSLLETVESDGSHTLWIGTYGGGLARLNKGRWAIFNAAEKHLPSDIVRSLALTVAPDARRTLWAGTHSGVAFLSLDDPQASWSWIVAKPEPDLPKSPAEDQSKISLPNNFIYEVRADARNRVYLCTNYGVARLTSNDGDWKEAKIETFTVEDGLPSNECNGGAAFIDGSETVWVGTVGGVAALDAKRESFEYIESDPRIEKFFVNGKEYASSEENEFSYDRNNVTFEYTSPTYFREEEMRYSTRLVGYDPAPSPFSRDIKRTYTNLPAGVYTFEIVARDAMGNRRKFVGVTFRIRPAPWLTWWAFLIYAALAVGAGYGVLRLRVRTLQKRNVELEINVAKRTVELAEKNEQLDRKVGELNQINGELVESQRRTNLVFSALTKALPGTTLDGKYELGAQIGAGGFGAVFEAQHLNLNRPVAVKVFRPASGNDSIDALKRFRQEGVSACRVVHPNAVAVLDSGVSDDGIAYIVMELLRGRSLTEDLRQSKRLSSKRCIEIAVPVCEALAAAHAEGVVHRDVKPDNIFLHQGKDGEVVKVVDFGIAKLIGVNSAELTETANEFGVIVGTALYMAPERFNNQPYDGKSDVYSVGVMLYQMLTGKTPFVPNDGGVVGLAMMHLKQPPPMPRTLAPDLPCELENLVLQALSKDPERRPTALELARHLLAVSHSALGAPTPRTPPTQQIENAPTLAGNRPTHEISHDFFS
jgi:serine/threonine protein kinase/ligand-binding sensor domain-containing protein